MSPKSLVFFLLVTTVASGWAQSGQGSSQATANTATSSATRTNSSAPTKPAATSANPGAETKPPTSANEPTPTPTPAPASTAAMPAPAATSSAPAPTTATPNQAQEEARFASLPTAEKVKGTCRTPEEAWLTLLYWLQTGERYEPEKAAACVEQGDLDKKLLVRRTIMLKEIIDAQGAMVDVDMAPREAVYIDERTGRHIYYDKAVKEALGGIIRVEKIGDKWLFPRTTIDAVPSMYPWVARWAKQSLPTWMQYRFLGIEIWKLLGIVILFFLARALTRLVLWGFRRYLKNRITATRASAIGKIIHKAERPLGGLTMAAVLYLGIPPLLLPLRFAQASMVAIKALAVISMVWLMYRVIDAISDIMSAKADKTESKLDDQLVPLVSKTLKVIVSIVGFIFVLQNLDVNVGSLIAGLGLGGLAFALAAKDTIANFFGSIMIFIDKPFHIGDWVVIGSTEGIIEEVGFRTSRVRTFYNSLVTVPNQLVTNAMIDNYGARQFRRYSTTLGLTYDTPADKVEAFCEGVRAIIRANPDMRHDYYVVEFKDYGASSLNILVYCFCTVDNYNDEMRVRTNLNLEILRLAKTLGVDFAFPTQSLHIESNVPPEAKEARPDFDDATLAAAIKSYGPGGERALPEGVIYAPEFDCGAAKKAGGDGE